jgi:drug/metabolite transporter (DMT)-like permease
MLGAILGLASAGIFSFNSILVRRGMFRASANYFATLTVFTGPPFFLIIALLAGALGGTAQYSRQALFFWVVSGLVHFGLGRSWAYKSIQMVGANRSNIMTSLNPIVTVVLAVLVLGETLPFLMILGILFSLSGPLIIVMKEHGGRVRSQASGPSGKEADRRILFLGMMYGAGAAVFWGSSAIFIKLALNRGGSPLTGTLISYLAASLFISPSLLREKNRREMVEADRKSLQMALLSGLSTNVAQLFKFIALAYGSVIVVSLMSRTVPLWVLLLSFLFNRESESFSPWVIAGTFLLVAGTVLVMFC